MALISKAAFLGRFQPFHIGHNRTIEEYKDRYSDFVLVVGSSSKSKTERNPLTFSQRKSIIETCHPDIEIKSLEDEDKGKKGHKDWTQRFVNKTEAQIVITRNKLVRKLVKEYSEAKIEKQKRYGPKECSGSKIRENIRRNRDWKHLAPDCSIEKIEEYKDVINRTEG